MKRRKFLIGGAVTAAGVLTRRTSRAQSAIGPRLIVSYEEAGPVIAADFHRAELRIRDAFSR